MTNPHIKVVYLHARFGKDDMVRLCSALSLPEKYTCPQGTSATAMEALMILLRRLAYPNRLCELVPIFGYAEPELSQIFNTVSGILCQTNILCAPIVDY